jgi:hypothetical protein
MSFVIGPCSLLLLVAAFEVHTILVASSRNTMLPMEIVAIIYEIIVLTAYTGLKEIGFYGMLRGRMNNNRPPTYFKQKVHTKIQSANMKQEPNGGQRSCSHS